MKNNKTKIVAIGGGEIGRPGFPIQTLKIDQRIVSLTKKPKPRLLFIPTASSDSNGYVNVVKKYFDSKHKCKVDTLFLFEKSLSRKFIENKIMNSDIIYVGGGNTLKMMRIWRKNNLDHLLKKAAANGVVLSGLSAGAICWFKYGISDSRKFRNPDADFIKVTGINMINALFCPHYDVEKDRKSSLKKLMKKTPGVAIALDNCCAIEIVGNNYRIINSKKTAKAYRVFWRKGKYFEQQIKTRSEFSPTKTLLDKKSDI